MDSAERGAIIVGVTGPGRETAALKFAAECARRDGAEVLLVHAFRLSHQPPPPSVLMSSDDAWDVAHWITKQVGEEFEEMTKGSVRFRTVARAGSPARVLVDLSAGARMLVVQHRASHILGHLFVGSTLHGAAAHAHCPVISVRTGWTPPEAPGEVVVGVHEAGGPREALEAGFAWAEATGAGVRVVHAWRLDAAYDDIITERVAHEWEVGQETSLALAVEDFRRAHPDVPVRLEVRHQWPTQVLVDLSETASLVVLGRHGHLRWLPERLGAFARTVLREARSPVMVVPLKDGAGTPDDWGLAADEMSPQT